MTNKIMQLVTAIFIASCLKAQVVKMPEKVMESFEDGIPAGLTSSVGLISLDTLRIKHGNQALKWDWIANDALIFNTPIGYHKQRYVSELKQEGRDEYNTGSVRGDNKTTLKEPPRGFLCGYTTRKHQVNV